MEAKIVPHFKNSSLILVLVSCQSSKESRDIKLMPSQSVRILPLLQNISQQKHNHSL